MVSAGITVRRNTFTIDEVDISGVAVPESAFAGDAHPTSSRHAQDQATTETKAAHRDDS